IPGQLNVPVPALNSRPTSENGPKEADFCIAAKSSSDHWVEIFRLRIATKPLVRTGNKPKSPSPLAFEKAARGYPGTNQFLTIRNNSGHQGRVSVTMQCSKLMSMLFVATG